MLGFLALIVLAIIDGPSDSEPAGTNPSPSIEVDASDGGGDESADTDRSAAEDSGTTDDDASTGDSDETTASDPSGATGETDTVSVTVVSTERTQELRDSLWENTTDNEYFVIDISYANKSSKTLDLWASDVILVDTAGNEYEANTDVSLAVEDPIIIEEVNPGLTITGTLVFEVPPGTEFSELRFEETYGGAQVTIDFEE